MSIDEPEFVEYVRQMFAQHGSSYDEIIKRLADPKQKFEERAHFYYFICAPNKNEPDIRAELQLIGVISLMEAMMQDTDYKDAFEYFESEYPQENSISDVEKFKDEYLAKHGAARKVREYFKKYISDGEEEIEGFQIKKWESRGKSIQLTKIKEIAEFFYTMRSEFVHKAMMRSLRHADVSASYMSVGDRFYGVEMHISSFLKMFEASFVQYYKEKAGL